MGSRPTISDLARAAGVSVATVDRVINRRSPVRDFTARRVLAAAQDIGFEAGDLDLQRAGVNRRPKTLGFVLHGTSPSFREMLISALEEAAGTKSNSHIRTIIKRVHNLNQVNISGDLSEIGEKVDALGFVSVDDLAIHEAVASLQTRGVPVAALLSGLQSSAGATYIGIDNRKAGRTAGWIISQTASRPGEVGILVGSHRFLGRELREIGFRTFFREHFPDFSVLEAAVTLEDAQLAYDATIQLLHSHKNLVGIYVISGAEGVVTALHEAKADRNIKVVAHEVTPETRFGLMQGLITMIISTPVKPLAHAVIQSLSESVGHKMTERSRDIIIPFDLITVENL